MASISNQGKALYAWTGSEWIPLNGGTNFSTIQRWNKIFDGGETTISGNDENDNLLIYTPGYEQVYLNGILLVRNEDYTATDGVEINLSSPLNENDVLDIIIFIPVNIGNVYTREQSDARYATVIDLENIDLSLYLTQSGASATYLTQSSASTVYAPKQNPIFSGTASIPTLNLTNPLSISNGGTGQTTAANAINALLPSQSTNSGRYLTTNGTSPSWATLDLSTKADKLLSTNARVASYSLVLSDADKIVEMNVGSANNLTVPLNSSQPFPIGTEITIIQTGSGQTTIVPTGGVTVNATPGLKLRTQWSSATLIKRATDTWIAIGDLTP
jgi:hypothetical protein